MNPDELEIPIVLAPLAGGPATVDLAVAVSEAGGLGFLAGGYRTTEALGAQIDEFRSRSGRAFGINLFAPPSRRAPPDSYATYVVRLRLEAQRAGQELGEPRWDDDGWDAKLGLLRASAVPVASFVFGCPADDVVRSLQRSGSSVWVTVTTPDEARIAERAGVDALVVQGVEAGGHRGSFMVGDEQFGLISLLQLVGEQTELPLLAAGGIATGRGLAAALGGGACAGQLGTAFLCCPEAGTSDVHRDAVTTTAPTALTRAFSGKAARAIVNRFMREHGEQAPDAYPELHHVTSPLRQAGRAAGDRDLVNLWAGQTHQLARAVPAAEVVRTVGRDARAAIEQAASRAPGHS